MRKHVIKNYYFYNFSYFRGGFCYFRNCIQKNIRSWTFWRSTGCVLIIVAWTISAVFSLDYDNFKINYIGILSATIMVALIGKQTYGGEEKNSGEIAVKKDKIINAYSLICMAVCFAGFVMNVPWE